MRFIQPLKFRSQSFAHRNRARSQRLRIQPYYGYRLAYIFPLEFNNLPESHSCIKSADQNPTKSGAGDGQQPNLLFPAERSRSGNFISHRDQSLSVFKRRTSQPTHLNRLVEHPSQKRHFAVDAGNLSLPSGFFAFALCGRFQPVGLVVLKVVESQSLKASNAEESLKSIEGVAGAFITSHARYFPIIYIAWLYQVSLAEQTGKVLESFVVRRAGSIPSKDGLNIPLRSFPGIGFGSTGAPDRMPFAVRPGVGRATVETNFAVDLPFDDRESPLAHSIYAFIFALAESSGPDGALNSTNKVTKATVNAVKLQLCADRESYDNWIVDQESTVINAAYSQGFKQGKRARSSLSSTHAAALVQLVRTPDCGSGGRRFKSDMPPQITEGSRLNGVGLSSL